jgi:site-specific recombinase XerD
MIDAVGEGCLVVQRGIPHGASSLYLAAGVTFLNEEDSVFEAMREGWSMQQIGGRGLREASVRSALRVVGQFATFSGEWPWQWTAGGMDEWMTHLVAVRKLAPSTIRGHQQAVRSFCDYLISEHYGWDEECVTRFGTHPIQVCHDWNTTKHLQNYEGRPGRRPLTRDELQRLLDFADDEVDRLLDSGRKGALPAYRDATLLKVVYGWGLRVNEAVNLDVTDFYRNAHAPQFGRFGVLQVRHGKASRGGAPKRRSVITLRGWAVAAVEDYIENVWPLMRSGSSNALWVSERGTRLRPRELQDRFAQYRDQIGLDSALSTHSLRHSYVTHLVEEGVDMEFVRQQVGHVYQSTTSIYTAVSGDFANTMMKQALQRTLQGATEQKGTP